MDITHNNSTCTSELCPDFNSDYFGKRKNWTFTFDRKNRLKSFTHAGAGDIRTNLWYDGMDRVWQRWNDDSVTGDWEPELTRYVYDGSQLGQEHRWTAIGIGTWDYTYEYLSRDYLREPAGLRQRESSDGQNFTDRYLFTDGGIVASRADRGSSTAITRTMRLASGDRLPDALLGPGATAENWSNLSHLASRNSVIRDFGGGTSDPTKGFDALQQVGERHYLTGLGRWLSRRANNSYLDPTGEVPPVSPGEPEPIPTPFDPKPEPEPKPEPPHRPPWRIPWIPLPPSIPDWILDLIGNLLHGNPSQGVRETDCDQEIPEGEEGPKLAIESTKCCCYERGRTEEHVPIPFNDRITASYPVYFNGTHVCTFICNCDGFIRVRERIPEERCWCDLLPVHDIFGVCDTFIWLQVTLDFSACTGLIEWHSDQYRWVCNELRAAWFMLSCASRVHEETCYEANCPNCTRDLSDAKIDS